MLTRKTPKRSLVDVQYEDGTRVSHSLEDWGMVDVVTCYMMKRYAIESLHLHPFTKKQTPSRADPGPSRYTYSMCKNV
jgi:hypothetical protein